MSSAVDVTDETVTISKSAVIAKIEELSNQLDVALEEYRAAQAKVQKVRNELDVHHQLFHVNFPNVPVADCPECQKRGGVP